MLELFSWGQRREGSFPPAAPDLPKILLPLPSRLVLQTNLLKTIKIHQWLPMSPVWTPYRSL